eukprot:1146458-Pelagomonas_calceolata.AAC.7
MGSQCCMHACLLQIMVHGRSANPFIQMCVQMRKGCACCCKDAGKHNTVHLLIGRAASDWIMDP